jgi:16S rRNA (adenine1518-N6/adenine1519-N6)-dimethyltransferase
MPRRLGQHFLRDPAILDRIVAALDPQPDDVVLEIGPGEGTLTRRLASRVQRVVAIEKDRRLAAWLPPSLPGNVTVIEGDALEIDWHQPFPSKIIGNIPYNITSPLIEKALTPPLPGVIVFLVQKEVAERVTATPGSKAYGALSVGVQVAARAEQLFIVKAGAFAPPPKVDSALLRLTPLAEPLVPPTEHAAFRSFVVGLFGQRRKQLARSLRDVVGLDREVAERLLESAGLGTADRVETVVPEGLVRLHRLIVPPLPQGEGDRG